MIDWDKIRTYRYSTEAAPEHWPRGIKPISSEGLSLFGIDPASGKLYWDGQEVATVLKLAAVERCLAFIGTFSALGMFILKLGEAKKWW
ncbi:hypothetical protein IVB34_47785 [Bradyrhizobium sp. 2]|uniref:hypothetical protein n=1 Tax=unclassified Bradyrhizobium TaxID=2631580 RepID=UPI001FF773F1|nr:MULTISPECIES: hypothetical protein [unclassified Bradyrhizobium]MCK1465723.1 hypothetical protein [Bradyrhizobium sp. 2]MCK1465732.1 hypothetical protein [Bradyrhizobium sp. 2]MCK1465791.1 hypothetical protein [Bradyrhizobium sp. 2]MCK1520239.1 hypothetical protein [Bradyrhizobium sp. 17]